MTLELASDFFLTEHAPLSFVAVQHSKEFERLLCTCCTCYSWSYNIYYSCSKGNLQWNIKNQIWVLPCIHYCQHSLEKRWSNLKRASLLCLCLTALHSLGTESASSLCAQSRSSALLFPWRWWCLCMSTCSPESEECDMSPLSPIEGEAQRWSLVYSKSNNH